MCEATVIWKNTKLWADPSERSRGTSVLAADSVPVVTRPHCVLSRQVTWQRVRFYCTCSTGKMTEHEDQKVHGKNKETN